MMQLRPNIYAVGAIDWDRRLFDELIPLPDGTSYNAYLVKGSEKIALLDTTEDKICFDYRLLRLERQDG
jgi:flavorubredoxin